MRRRFVIHPVLFSVFPVLALTSHNIQQMKLSEALIPALVMLAAGTLLSALAMLARESRGPALVISLALICFFSYEHFHMLADILCGPHPSPDSDHWFLPLWIAIFVAAAVAMLRAKRRLAALTRFLDAAGIALVGMALAGCARGIAIEREANRRYLAPETIVADSLPVPLPDVYYIILDRYAGPRTLREQFAFDDSAFTNYLTSKGFYVAARSTANYLKTAPSLASSLNMCPINVLGDKLGRDCEDWLPIYALLQDHRAWRFFKSQGYRFYHFGSWWEQTSANKFADVNYNIYPFREFAMALAKTTLLYPLSEWNERLSRFLDFNDRRLQYERELYKFSVLGRLPAAPGPKFVFAHMLIPHEPFVYDRDGTYVPKEVADTRGFEVNYVNQLVFANQMAQELIDKLLSQSVPQPIIILQADEGPFPDRYRLDEKAFQWRGATRDELRRKMGILNAYYLPGMSDSTLYPTVTPVNSLRIVLNLYFHTHLKLFPDRCHAFENDAHPYSFFDVTDMVR